MYALDWLHEALYELQAYWSGADPSRRALLEWAIMDLDYTLSRDPHNEGESRPGNYRVAFSYPLAVLYTVDDYRHLAQIHHVWTYHR
jgi:hypothetical protein